MENIISYIPDNFSLIIIIIIFSGFIRGFLGFGSGLITIPLLSYIYSPIFAVVFNIIIEIPTTIYLTFSGLKNSKFKEIAPMFYSMMLMIPIGTIFLISVEERIIKIIMSTFVIFFVILIASGWRLKSIITKYVLVITGMISGLMQGSTGMGGPPFATIILSKGDNNQVTRGNILIMSSGIVLSTVISMFFFNLFSFELLITGILASPIYVLASYVGSIFFNSSGKKYFKNISLFALGTIGITTLLNSLFQY